MKREELILPSKYYGGFGGVFSPLTGGRISTVIPHPPLSQGCLIYRPMYHCGSVRVNLSLTRYPPLFPSTPGPLTGDNRVSEDPRYQIPISSFYESEKADKRFIRFLAVH